MIKLVSTEEFLNCPKNVLKANLDYMYIVHNNAKILIMIDLFSSNNKTIFIMCRIILSNIFLSNILYKN